MIIITSDCDKPGYKSKPKGVLNVQVPNFCNRLRLDGVSDMLFGIRYRTARIS